MQPLLELLEVCSVPFKKERCSDENTFVKKLPLFLNALCPFIKCTGLTDPKIDKSLLITTSASLVTKLASYQIEEIKNPKKKEVTENDKTKKGTINLSSPSKTQKKDTEEKQRLNYLKLNFPFLNSSTFTEIEISKEFLNQIYQKP